MLNPDFDQRIYLRTLARDGLNYTRIFTGSYFEPQGAFGIAKNTLAPPGARALTPWARSGTPGYAGGGNRFDLSQWDTTYFRRLRDFVRLADEHGVVVEVTLFSSIYGDAQWQINPLNRANNVNGTDSIPLQRVHTLDNGNVWAHQERLVRKIVRELNAFDNVIYEIQNEPWADNHTLAGPINHYLPKWEQEWMKPRGARDRGVARVAAARRRRRARRGGDAAQATSDRAELRQFPLPASGGGLGGVDPELPLCDSRGGGSESRVGSRLGLDETGFAGSDDATYRRQAWRFMLAGGALFDHLDYSFTVERPDGTDRNEAPGGGSPALRKQLGVLKRFVDGFDFVRMRPDRRVVRARTGRVPRGARGRGARVRDLPGRAAHGRPRARRARGHVRGHVGRRAHRAARSPHARATRGRATHARAPPRTRRMSRCVSWPAESVARRDSACIACDPCLLTRFRRTPAYSSSQRHFLGDASMAKRAAVRSTRPEARD